MTARRSSARSRSSSSMSSVRPSHGAASIPRRWRSCFKLAHVWEEPRSRGRQVEELSRKIDVLPEVHLGDEPPPVVDRQIDAVELLHSLLDSDLRARAGGTARDGNHCPRLEALAVNPLQICHDLGRPARVQRDRDREILTCIGPVEADDSVAAAITTTADWPHVQASPSEQNRNEPLEPLMVCQRVNAPPSLLVGHRRSRYVSGVSTTTFFDSDNV
jgi:hypothetical protein